MDEWMAYQSEYALENEVFQQIGDLNYKRINIHNIESEINEYIKELGALKHVWTNKYSKIEISRV